MKELNYEKFIEFCRKKIKEGKFFEKVLGIYYIITAIFLSSLYYSLDFLIFVTILLIFTLSFIGPLVIIGIRFKFPWKKNVKNYNEKFYREVKILFSGNILDDKNSLESCRSWFSKARIFDGIKFSGYILSIFLLVYYILLLIEIVILNFSMIYVEKNTNFIFKFLFNPFLKYYIFCLTWFLLFNITELYINRLKLTIDDIIREAYNDIEDKNDNIFSILNNPDSINYEDLQKDIKTEIINIQNLYSLNILKVLKKSEHRFKLKYLYKQFKVGGRFDLIKIINSYLKCIEIINSKNEDFEYYDVFYNYSTILAKLKKEIILESESIINETKDYLNEYKEVRVNKTDIREKKNTINNLISDFELTIRQFIKNQLKKHFSEDWWNQGIPSKIRKDAEVLKSKKEIIEPKRTYQVIDFLTFMDYSNIILNKKNWNNIFSDFFNQKYIFQAPFEKLTYIRNDLAHNRFIEDDFERCKTYIKDILKYIPDFNRNCILN